MKDSGKRQQFDGGMVRDTEDEKVNMLHLYQHFEPMGTRFAAHMTKAAAKYQDVEPGVPNWTLADADPELVERFKRSAARHFKQWLRGDDDEDHAAAILFNVNGAEYVKAQLAVSVEDQEILDVFGYDDLLDQGGYFPGDLVVLKDRNLYAPAADGTPGHSVQDDYFPLGIVLKRKLDDPHGIYKGWWTTSVDQKMIHPSQIREVM